jgi:hypothetical protein
MLPSYAIQKSTAARNIVCTYFIIFTVHYCGTSVTDLNLMLFETLILAKYNHTCMFPAQWHQRTKPAKVFFMTRRPILCTIQEHCAYEFITHRSPPPPPHIQRSTFTAVETVWGGSVEGGHSLSPTHLTYTHCP